MLDRVEMDIIDVARKISLIAYRVFPKPPLPDTSLFLGNSGGGLGFTRAKSRRETTLDESASR
jgi:hypothetical protein